MLKTALIVFLKRPEKGRVKTRLSKDLDENFVLELYKAFVADLLETLESVKNKRFFVWPVIEASVEQLGKNKALAEKKNQMEELIGKGMSCSSQQGSHLGQKMANAFGAVFDQGYERVVLIGTDIPEINCEMILKAYDILKTHNAVVGPSTDGGYYLIGFQKSGFSKSIFDHIEWSTPKVLSQTVARMKQNSIACGFLPQLDDIDTLEDLRALVLRVKKGGGIGRRTRRMLEQL